MAGNIVGATYEAIASGRIDQITGAMDGIINSEVTFVHPILKSLFVIFVGRQFFLTYLGHESFSRFMNSTIRGGIIVLLLVHSGEFASRVKDPVFTRIPQAIASMATGVGNSSQSIAQQFDGISAAADAITARVQAQNTGWSVSSLVNSASAGFSNFEMQFVLACIVGIWLLAQMLLAIVICFGPLLLGFELFERTRGFVDQWIGKLVGMIAFGLATSILLSIQMNGMRTMMESALANSGANTAARVGDIGHIASNLVLDLLAMAALPTIVGFGSGVAASLAAPSALIAMRSITMGATGARAVGTSGVRGASALASHVSAPRRNSIAR